LEECKLAKVKFYQDHKSLLFFCPGCKHAHGVNISPIGNQPVWEFNGNDEVPTIAPSILVKWDEGDDHKQCCCHSFVKDGEIQFLSDCTHTLAGQTVELPDW
jgi:hypothetical protein